MEFSTAHRCIFAIYYSEPNKHVCYRLTCTWMVVLAILILCDFVLLLDCNNSIKPYKLIDDRNDAHDEDDNINGDSGGVLVMLAVVVVLWWWRWCMVWVAMTTTMIQTQCLFKTSSPLLLRGAPDYSIYTVTELTRQSTNGNCEWRTCQRSLRGG